MCRDCFETKVWALAKRFAEPKPPPKVGRPPTYPLEMVAPLFEQGLKDGIIAKQLGASRQTINAIRQRWRRKRAVDVEAD